MYQSLYEVKLNNIFKEIKPVMRADVASGEPEYDKIAQKSSTHNSDFIKFWPLFLTVSDGI